MNKQLLITAVLTVGLTGVSLVHAAEKNHRGWYAGLFGGGAGIEDGSISQSTIVTNRAGSGGATATYDLYVESQGKTTSDAAGFGGLHGGYEFAEIPFGQSGWGVRPAIEFEGYYLRTEQSASLVNSQTEYAIGNPTYNLPAGTHNFKESFDLDIGVMLANMVFSFKTPWSDSIFPYIGGGAGANISARRKVVSTQITPVFEPTVNHFNADDNGSRSGFAAQGKAGVRAEITDNLSLFAEYRYLYASESNYVFGPTFYPVTHPRTVDWGNHFGSVNVHAGALGVDYSF